MAHHYMPHKFCGPCKNHPPLTYLMCFFAVEVNLEFFVWKFCIYFVPDVYMNFSDHHHIWCEFRFDNLFVTAWCNKLSVKHFSYRGYRALLKDLQVLSNTVTSGCIICLLGLFIMDSVLVILLHVTFILNLSNSNFVVLLLLVFVVWRKAFTN